MADPAGSVYIELAIKCRRALSLLVEKWPDEEKAALLAGDAEAREALIDAMHLHALRNPDDVDCLAIDIRMRGGDKTVTSPRKDETDGHS